jgi:hypothetical protein
MIRPLQEASERPTVAFESTRQPCGARLLMPWQVLARGWSERSDHRGGLGVFIAMHEVRGWSLLVSVAAAGLFVIVELWFVTA